MPFYKTGIANIPKPEPMGLMDKSTGQAITLAMQRLDLTGELTPLGASLQVTHKFKCEGTQPMEAVYVFMLPRGGTLRRFKIKGKGFESNSKLALKEKAKEEYEDGVRHGHLSAMTEQAPDGMVSLTVGQIRPDEEVAIMLDIFCGVDLQDSKFRFRFPFTLAPSYHAKMVVAPTTDGGRIELPQTILGDLVLPEWKLDAENLHQVSFNLKVRTDITGISSPSHRVKTETKKGETTISLAELKDKPNRDLVLDVGMEIDKPLLFVNGKGFVAPKNTPRWAVVVPSATLPQKDMGSKKLCFVLDHSGSMSGGPLKQAKLALSACLSTLDAKDEFGIVAFESVPTPFKQSLIKASKQNREEAQRFLDTIHPMGGTELKSALEMAVNGFDGAEGDIYLLTDGEVYESAVIVEYMAKSKIRVHVLGIGSASQDRFLASLAKKTSGVSKMMTPNEDVSSGALELFNSVRYPRQKDVTISAKGSSIKESVVWDGKPVILYGNSSKAPAKVTLKFGKSTKDVKLSTSASCPEGLVSLLWAGQTLEDLGSSLDGDPNMEKATRQGIEKQMENLSTTFNLSSRVMSLYAVVKRKGDKKQEMVQNVVAVGYPEGLSTSAYGMNLTVMPTQIGGGITRGRFAATKNKISTVTTDNIDSVLYSPMNSNYCLALNDTVKAYNTTASVNTLALNGTMDSNNNFNLVSASYVSNMVECSEDANSSADSICYEEKTCGGLHISEIDRLLEQVNLLEEDGGMPGKDLEERVVKTLMLGLWILGDQGENAHKRFGKHLKKMADFIEKNAPEEKKTLIALALVTFRNADSNTATPSFCHKNDYISLTKKRVWDRLEAIYLS
jgi:Ca-activated chloride channel family protein